jgi:hypothetical protein
MRRSLFLVLLLLTSIARADDRSWVAVHIFDSIFPMTEEQSFPEALASIESIQQTFNRWQIERQVNDATDAGGDFGSRSSEGHFMIWIHLSDSFLARHRVDRNAIGERLFMFRDRETDIFTGWSGGTNTPKLLTHGILAGLATPIRQPDGRPGGEFQGFADAIGIGDADYEGGWYINDLQALRLLDAFRTYPGKQYGYSFLRPVSDPRVQMVNGYNCGDFVFYALREAGLVTPQLSEALKIHFWYPPYFYDHPIRLKGVGAKAGEWSLANPDAAGFPSDKVLEWAWQDMIFGSRGVEFWDKRWLVEWITRERPRLRHAKIWDQAKPILWLSRNKQFRSKGIVTELKAYYESGARILSPDRTVAETRFNRFLDSRTYRRLYNKSAAQYARKLDDATIAGTQNNANWRLFYNSLKGE